MYHVRCHLHLVSGTRTRRRRLLVLSTVILLAVLSAAAPDARAQGVATWNPAFEVSGLDDTVNALATDSDGNLYAAGTFTTAGGQPATRIAKWDGTSWTALGSGISGGGSLTAVHALAIDDAGNLYAAGLFTLAGGVKVANIAKWDGTSWSALGAGLNAIVNALAVDASGNVYAGGNFTTAGGITANRVAKWDGTSWSALGAGMDRTVVALAFDAENNLYAGGDFNTVAIKYIAKWDGASWSSLGNGTTGVVRAIAVDADGNVYAGGDFSSAGGASAYRVARWNGATWTTLSTGADGNVHALEIDADGILYAGGDFTTLDGQDTPRVAMWDGVSWSALGSGVDKLVKALEAGDTSLFLGGDFTSAGDLTSPYIGEWGLVSDSQVEQAAPAPIRPVASATTVTPGQSFSVAVEVGADTAAVSDLFGVGFALHFDPALVQASSATAGSFLDDGDLIFDETIDNTTGTVTVGVSRKRGAADADGYGAIARIDFTTIHTGAPQSAGFSLSDVLAVDPDGAEIPLTIKSGEVDINTLAVWPGDTDNDGGAGISDVLPVGIHFGVTGPPRSGGGFTWEAQTAQEWTPGAATYADATGDGVVNQNDILPIGVNFGLNRGTPPDAPALRAASTPLASLRLPALPVGERFTAILSLESAGYEMDDLLGYAAELSLPASLKVEAARPGALLGDSDLLTLSQTSGVHYSVAHTRKGTAGPVSGKGPLLELSFEVTAPMNGLSTISLDALSLGTLDGVVAAGQGTPVTLMASLTVPNESDAPMEFKLHGTYPNPFTSRAAIAFDLPEDARVTVSIYDVLGRVVERIDAGALATGANHRIEIQGARLSSGSYVYRLRADMAQSSEIATGRFVLAR